MSEATWRPKLVALDIDGTLLRWVTGSGAVHGEVDPVVRDAVRRAAAAGAEIVLASGRSIHGMIPIAEQLGLPSTARSVGSSPPTAR
nr:HAD hydrolase family protein [Nocardioides alcanivorans]